jgi:hypothetical protein
MHGWWKACTAARRQCVITKNLWAPVPPLVRRALPVRPSRDWIKVKNPDSPAMRQAPGQRCSLETRPNFARLPELLGKQMESEIRSPRSPHDIRIYLPMIFAQTAVVL